ncbi:BlaI/MecI/CopY family transcriptional regulator [Streptomyces sp. DSM 118878]
MSEVPANAAGVQGQYAAQVAADLEANRKEQERISAEVTALTEQLQVLENDHSLLVNMQQALGANGTGGAPASASKKGASRAKAAPKSQRAKKASTPRKKSATTATATPSAKAAGKSTTKSAAAKATPKVPAARTPEPTLGELIRDHLAAQSEPRSSAEIASALTEAHPDRTIKTTVVRTTVEKLVAKSQVQRTRQGSSVFYSATAPSEKSAPSQPEAAAS